MIDEQWFQNGIIQHSFILIEIDFERSLIPPNSHFSFPNRSLKCCDFASRLCNYQQLSKWNVYMINPIVSYIVRVCDANLYWSLSDNY